MTFGHSGAQVESLIHYPLFGTLGKIGKGDSHVTWADRGVFLSPDPSLLEEEGDLDILEEHRTILGLDRRRYLLVVLVYT